MEDDRILGVIVGQADHPQHHDLVVAGDVGTLDGALEMDRRLVEEKRAAREYGGVDAGEAPGLVLRRQLPDDLGVGLTEHGDPSVGRPRRTGQVVELCWTANITSGGSCETPTANDEATMTVGSSPAIPARATTPVGKAPKAFRSSVLSLSLIHI